MPQSSDDLVLGLYDAVLDPGLWPARLADMAALIGAETFTCAVQRRESQDFRLIGTALPIGLYNAYLEDGWWMEDAFVLGALHRPRGTALLTADMISDTDYLRSRFYNELVLPHAPLRRVVGSLLEVDGLVGMVGLHRYGNAGDFDERHRQGLGRMLPHLQRAMQLMLRLDQLQQRWNWASAALDALPYPAMVVDAQCRPLLLTAAAERLLATRDALSGGSPQRPLLAAGEDATRRLHRLVAEAASRPPSPGGAIALARRSGQAPLAVLVCPLVGRSATLLGQRRPAALLLVQDHDNLTPPRPRVLRDLYGLTAAEAALAEQLATGARLEDVADQRGVRISTLRSQLSAILGKTDTSRQAALVRLLASLSFGSPGGTEDPRPR